MTPSRRGRAANAALFLAALLMSLLLVEAALRLAADPTGLLPLTVRDPLTGRPWHCVAYDDRSRAAGYDPGREHQAAIVGDSFAYGEGVKETDTLGYLLNQKHPRVNFRNYAASGLDSPADPDAGPLARALARSRLYALIEKTWAVRRESARATRNYRDMYLGEDNRSAFEATMDLLKGINEMARERGVSFAVVVHPLLNKDLLGRHPFEDLHRVLVAACRERGIPCLDGHEPFRRFFSLGRFTVNPVDYHPNGLSNRTLADYIHDSGFLDATGRVR